VPWQSQPLYGQSVIGSLPGEPRPRPMPPSLDEAVDLLVAPGPIRG